jgi:hypothetical protein
MPLLLFLTRSSYVKICEVLIAWRFGYRMKYFNCCYLKEMFCCDSNVIQSDNVHFKKDSRVDRPVIEHLSALGRSDPRGGLRCFLCSHKTWTPLLGASDTVTIVENGLEMWKLWPPKVKRVKISKIQIIKHCKASSQTFKNFFVCCFVAIRVQRWFVEIWVTLL